jgi:hypothetical protein
VAVGRSVRGLRTAVKVTAGFSQRLKSPESAVYRWSLL